MVVVRMTETESCATSRAFRGETPTLIFEAYLGQSGPSLSLPPLRAQLSAAFGSVLLSLACCERSPCFSRKSSSSCMIALGQCRMKCARAPMLLLDLTPNSTLHRMTPYQPSRDFLSTTSSRISQFPARAFPTNSESLEFLPFPLLKSTTRSGVRMMAQLVRGRERTSRTRWIANSRRRKRRKTQ